MLGKFVLARGDRGHQRFAHLPREVRRRLAEMDWDRAGLQRGSPARRGVGGVTLFLLGALTGGLLALMLAPRPGAELRGQVRSRAQTLLGTRHSYPQAPAEA